MQHKKERVSSVSIAKCIGICLMVVAHCSSPEPLRAFIGQFHMPLFFFFSGYFYKPQTSMSEVKTYFCKKLKRLWWPYLYWGIPFLLISPCLMGFGYEDAGWDNSKELLVRLLQMIFLMDHHYGEAQPGFWFLKTLFHASVLTSLLMYACKKIKAIPEWTIFPLLVCAACCLSYWQLPVLHKTCFGAVYAGIYMLIGYYYRRVEAFLPTNWVAIIVLFSATIIGSRLYRGHGFLEADSLHMVISGIFFAVSGTICTFGISKKLCQLKISHLLEYIGDNTLIILALHAPVIRIINVVMVFLFGMPSEHMNEQFFPNYVPCLWILYAILGISVPIGIKRLSLHLSAIDLKKMTWK